MRWPGATEEIYGEGGCDHEFHPPEEYKGKKIIVCALCEEEFPYNGEEYVAYLAFQQGEEEVG